MIIGRKKTYVDVIDVPEGRAGSFKVKHVIRQPGEPVMAGNLRTAIFRGQPSKSLLFDRPTRWHQLLEDGNLWMTDYPIEQLQIDDELKGFHGHVIVGGLGLGYAVKALLAKPRVKSITVVELSAEVLKLVAESCAHDKVQFVHGDLMTFVKNRARHAAADGKARYDCAFYDTWASDGDYTFFNTVCPLLEWSRALVKDRVACWNEKVMRGSLKMSLQSRIMMATNPDLQSAQGATHWDIHRLAAGVPDDATSIFVNWSRPFFRWVRDRRPNPRQVLRGGMIYGELYGRRTEDEIGDALNNLR